MTRRLGDSATRRLGDSASRRLAEIWLTVEVECYFLAFETGQEAWWRRF